MVTTASIARVAALIGDPTRASMLQALMEGRALTAAELAGVARVARQTASGHLAQLTTAGLVTVARQGRHRYHRLATPLVGHLLWAVVSWRGDPRAPRCPMSCHQKDPLRPLTADERQELTRLSRSLSAPAAQVERARALLAIADGASYTAAAHQVGRRHNETISAWVSRFNRDG